MISNLTWFLLLIQIFNGMVELDYMYFHNAVKINIIRSQRHLFLIPICHDTDIPTIIFTASSWYSWSFVKISSLVGCLHDCKNQNPGLAIAGNPQQFATISTIYRLWQSFFPKCLLYQLSKQLRAVSNIVLHK